MRYRISEIKLSAREYADADRRMVHLQRALERKLKKHGRGRSLSVSEIEIIRESIDARRKPDVKAVYTLDFTSEEKLSLPVGAPAGYNSRYEELRGKINYVACDVDAMEDGNAQDTACRPVITGFGPCGIFAALTLAEAGLRPIVLERGLPVDQRVQDVQRFWETGRLDPESNVQFGEGGAGTFSDGKLTTGIKDPRIRKVLTSFVLAGADPAILYQQRPHIGTDQLRQIIPRIRQRIIDLGGEIRFGTRLTQLEITDEKLAAVHTQSDRIETGCLILAIGHSARDTFRMLQEAGLAMEQKAFSIGVRIEHPQATIDAAQYGDPALAEVFGPAVYKLSHRCENGRGVYTFCMCPGGRVINASSEETGAVTNGMSESARDSGTANSGLLVDVRPGDFDSEDPLAGVAFQRRYEALALEAGKAFPGGLPQTRYGRFRQAQEDVPTDSGMPQPDSPAAGNLAPTDPDDTASTADPVRGCLPAFAADAIAEAMPHLGRKLKGFDAPDAVMTAVETRSSSPVRILRDGEMQSTAVRGVIPAGEGAGYAGGIMSAAVDGIRAAEQVLREAGATLLPPAEGAADRR